MIKLVSDHHAYKMKSLVLFAVVIVVFASATQGVDIKKYAHLDDITGKVPLVVNKITKAFHDKIKKYTIEDVPEHSKYVGKEHLECTRKAYFAHQHKFPEFVREMSIFQEMANFFFNYHFYCGSLPQPEAAICKKSLRTEGAAEFTRLATDGLQIDEEKTTQFYHDLKLKTIKCYEGDFSD